MCSICGFIDYSNENSNHANLNILDNMGKEMRRRGPDQSGEFFTDTEKSNPFVGLQHNRLSIIDPKNGKQPMSAIHNGVKYTIVYNGELYNTKELSHRICTELGYSPFKTKCDTEVLLWTYILWGGSCPSHLNGIFAFAIYSQGACKGSNYPQKMFLARDRLGVKPLFYSQTREDKFVFASEIKALLEHPTVSRDVDMYGLWQLFYLTPVTIPGKSVFKDIFEIEAGCCALIDCRPNHIPKPIIKQYWELVAKPNYDTREMADEYLFELLKDSINRQLVSDVPLCVFLSGGLDSSIIAAVASSLYKKQGRELTAYSFEYEGNHENFKTTLFQPNKDDYYAKYLSDHLGINQKILTAPTKIVADRLRDAVYARDFPGQADIDSSLLYYCSQIKKEHTVALSGECADEIFGGYPWFYRSDMLYRNFFPWVHDPHSRIGLLHEDISKKEQGYEWLSEEYTKSLYSCDTLPSDSEEMISSRRATMLSAKYFMTNLLERKDRMSMYSGVEVRVPFSDHRIIEYVYNLPWNYKYDEQEYPDCPEKALLRRATKHILPKEIINRKKSPYPKTHNPAYEEMVVAMLNQSILQKDSMLGGLIDKTKLENIIKGNDITWLGQLMSRPQLLAWLYQLEVWLHDYKINLKI